MGLAQGFDRLIDLAALALEVVNLRGDLFQQQTHFELHLAGIIHSAGKDVGNLGQGESERFALKNHL